MHRDKQRAVTFLTRRQIDFLDKLGKDALFSQGSKLSRSDILSELVNFLMSLGISLKGTDLSNHDFSEIISEVVNNNHLKEEEDTGTGK